MDFTCDWAGIGLNFAIEGNPSAPIEERLVYASEAGAPHLRPRGRSFRTFDSSMIAPGELECLPRQHATQWIKCSLESSLSRGAQRR